MDAPITLQFEDKNRYLIPAFIISCLIHSGLIIALLSHSKADPKKEQSVFMVEMVPPKLAPKVVLNTKKVLAIPTSKASQPPKPDLAIKNERQYVSRPDTGLNEKPKVETNFLSDVDSRADKEQIRRGEGEDAGSIISNAPFGNNVSNPPTPPTPKEKQLEQKKDTVTNQKKELTSKTNQPENNKNTVTKNATFPKKDTVTKNTFPKQALGSTQTNLAQKQVSVNKNATKSLKTLDLNPNYALLNSYAKQPRPQNNNNSQALEPAPFSRSAGSGARFIGLNGSSDFIPGVSDGDITLLNAKADKFAVFVRRVATQVFHQLKQQGWEYVSASDIRQIQRETALKAKLSASGQLLGIEFLQRSGSQNFDNVVYSAVQKSASDPHPPQDARAKDGNIYFIFMTKAWVQMGLSRRGGMPHENRWLLLKTGLE